MIEDLREPDIVEAMRAHGFSFERPVGSKDDGLTYVFERDSVRTD